MSGIALHWGCRVVDTIVMLEAHQDDDEWLPWRVAWGIDTPDGLVRERDCGSGSSGRVDKRARRMQEARV